MPPPQLDGAFPLRTIPSQSQGPRDPSGFALVKTMGEAGVPAALILEPGRKTSEACTPGTILIRAPGWNVRTTSPATTVGPSMVVTQGAAANVRFVVIRPFTVTSH